jgi:uncharacterized membrane protein YbhN (UPF0104 family)
MKFSFHLAMASGLLSIGGHLIFATSYYVLFREFQPVSLPLIVAVIITAQLVNIVPISIGGIGPSDGAIVTLASLAGVAYQSALVGIAIALAARYLLAFCGCLIELVLDGKAFLTTIARNKKSNQEQSKLRL